MECQFLQSFCNTDIKQIDHSFMPWLVQKLVDIFWHYMGKDESSII